jgi:sphingomyelin phosphodiesterase D
MFKHIASARQAGHTITFVWLDMKNPDDYSGTKYPGQYPNSTFEVLRDLARQYLTPVGIGILYGFYGTGESEAYRTIAKDLRENEAIALDGDAQEMKKYFDTYGPADAKKRIISRGHFNLDFPTGYPESKYDSLKDSAKSGLFNKVFGWTVLQDQQYVLGKMLDYAHVDGVIYGRAVNSYNESITTLITSDWIKNELAKRGDRYRLAESKDRPW